jgi:hypothetical protein
MSTATIDPAPNASVIIDFDTKPQIELDGGESSVTIEQTGTNVFVGTGGGALTWEAPSAQSVWMIPHNLGRHPVVSIRDSTGAVIVADVRHLDTNVLTVTFSQPVLGSADLA